MVGDLMKRRNQYGGVGGQRDRLVRVLKKRFPVAFQNADQPVVRKGALPRARIVAVENFDKTKIELIAERTKSVFPEVGQLFHAGIPPRSLCCKYDGFIG